MTDEQKHKACAAILQKTLDDLNKYMAYKNHCAAAEWVTLYNLPYRVALDYQKNLHTGKVCINPMYPLPGYPVSELLTIPVDEMDFDRFTTEREDGSRVVSMEAFCCPKPEALERIQANNADLHPTWNLNTAAGLREWEKYFAHYLIGYDIDHFTMFDMFGRQDGNKGDLNERKQYYRGVIDRYNTASDYLTEAPDYLPEYAEQYTTHEFLLQWDNKDKGGI